MFLTMRCSVAVLCVVVLAPFLSAGAARAQSSGRQSRLSALQQQNALLQQQNAVQTAAQQTAALVQTASVQSGAPNVINFQQQQAALEIALQQTNALLQTSFRQNSGLSQTALRQSNVLQGVLQQTLVLRSALTMQTGTLTVAQLQTLSQEQSSLMGLLTSQPPPLPRKTSRK
jgi:hypothetical protein